jgi:hypothetical protein
MNKKTESIIICLVVFSLVFLIVPLSYCQIVEQPQISDIKVNAFWETNGQKSIDIMGTQTLAINLTQMSTVESSGIIQVTGGMPESQGTGSIAPGETKTIYVVVTNPGEEQQINNFPITVTAFDAFTGEQTSNDTVTCNFLANLGPSTTLNIHVEDNSNKPIVGLQLQVCYPASTAETNTTEYADSNGNIKMNVETPNGGGYTGPLIIQTVETPDYRASTLTTSVNSGQNDVSVNVISNEIQATESPVTNGINAQLIIEVIALVGFLAFLTVIAVAYTRRNAKPNSVNY